MVIVSRLLFSRSLSPDNEPARVDDVDRGMQRMMRVLILKRGTAGNRVGADPSVNGPAFAGLAIGRRMNSPRTCRGGISY